MVKCEFVVKFYKDYDDGVRRLIFTRKYKDFESAFLYYQLNKGKMRNNGIFLGFKSI